MDERTKSLPDSLDEKDLADKIAEGAADQEELPTPPPSPRSKSPSSAQSATPDKSKDGKELVESKDARPSQSVVSSIFSMAQVSMKLGELWSATQERVFGEDYWIPTGVYDVVIFPNEFLKNHVTVYPPHADENSDSIPTLRVVHCQAKTDNPEYKIINHVVFSHAGHSETLSIFRTEDVNEATDFCRRCEECRVLFKMLDLGTYKDIRRQVRDLTIKFQAHPLWRMVHIAISCQRADVFTEDGLEYLRKMGYSEDDIIKPVAQPEGKFPVHLAIESNQPEIVKFLFRHKADIHAIDTEGNNCLHMAALTSTQMIEIVWSQENSKDLLNALNNDRNTPALLAIKNANPFCLKTLMNCGADISMRVAGKNPLFEAVQSKGKTIDIIRAIIDAQPDLITEVEEATGNTVLHAALFKMPLMGVLNLRREELDLNQKNKAGFTALHLFVARGEIGMIITICSYGCDMNTQDNDGNTALHIAVSKNNLAVVRLLLCLGSDPNILNNHQETPRHLAAKLNEHALLKSLIICNANRCAQSKKGCVSGCVNEKLLRILPKSNSISSTQSDPETIKSPRSLAKIEELEMPEDMVEQHSWNKFHEFEHEEIYKEIILRLEEMAKKKQKNKNIINALCLDGGGIRGLVLTSILLEIEYQLGEPLFKYFDWVAGTSTGSLVAAALSCGKTIRDCQLIYLRFKDLIFDGWVRPYKSVILETFIKAEMGEETLIGDLEWPRLMFTTTRADVFPVQLEFMRNYQLPLKDEENEKLGYGNPKDLKLWKALRRTSAAPTYFSSVDNKYIDGGIMANNPTLDFLSEVQTWNTVCKTLNIPNQIEVGCLLSIGTGVVPPVQMDASQLDISNNPYSSAVAIKNLGVILVDQVTATEGAPVNRASAWCITRRTPYFRLSAPLHKEVAMDERQDDVLAKMMWDCYEYAYRQRPYIKRICALLKKIGPAESRRHLFEKPSNNIGTQTDFASQTSTPSEPNKTLFENGPKEEVIFKTSSSDEESSVSESLDNLSGTLPVSLGTSKYGSSTTLRSDDSLNTRMEKKDLAKEAEKRAAAMSPDNPVENYDVKDGGEENGEKEEDDSEDSPKLTRSDMIKATQGDKRKGDRDSSPKASKEEIKEAKEMSAQHESSDSNVTKGSPRVSQTKLDKVAAKK